MSETPTIVILTRLNGKQRYRYRLGLLANNVQLMRLTLLDRIVELEPGRQIKAVKCLTLQEDYLVDHFPGFAIMPGVLMLEAMYQAAAWLTRATDNFAYSMVLLSEANNVKFSDFVEPGESLVVTAEVLKHEQQISKLKCQGTVDGQVAVRGRLVLESYNLAERESLDDAVDELVANGLQEKFRSLYPAGLSEKQNS